MERLVAGHPAALTATFRDGIGDDIDATGVTVEAVSRRTGDTVIGDPTPETATIAGGGASGPSWQLLLLGDEVTQPDIIDVTWHVTDAGGTVDRTAVVAFDGAGYVDLGELRAQSPSSQAADLIDVISEVANRIEVATGWVWVPRFAQATVVTDRHGTARLPADPPLRPLRQVLTVVDDDANTIDTASWATSRIGVLHTGRADATLTVTCEVGEDRPTADLVEAATTAARIGALEGRPGRGSRSRAELPESGIPFQTASLRHGRPFGIDGADAIVMSHDHRTLAGA